MQSSLNEDKLSCYLARQLMHAFPDEADLSDLSRIVSKALVKLEHCFQSSRYAPYWRDEICYFNHLNADQYVIFIYFCSGIAFFDIANLALAEKLFYLNKSLHSFHCMYDTILPEIFLVVHGSGIVLGKASYSNYFVVMHGCTVGSNSKFETPSLGPYLFMYPHSSITGKCLIGENVCIARGSHVNDELIPVNSLVFRSSPELILKINRRDRLSHVYDIS